MRFSVLGQLQVVGEDGAELRVVQPRQRALLTVLLLHANEEMSTSRLTESLWDTGGSTIGPGALRTQVWALRKLLAPARRLHTGEHRGYQLEVRPGELDVAQFRQLAGQGRRGLESADLPGAVTCLTQALGLWGEPPLADVPATLAMGPVAQRLLDERAAARELLNEARLGLGQHASLIPELRESTAANPANERLWEQLILALHRAGRTAEALAAYQQARTSMQAELGLEPGHSLQELHRRILANDPKLTQLRTSPTAGQRQKRTGQDPAPAKAGPVTARPDGEVPGGGREPVVPRQLPAPVRPFVGRETELAELDSLLERAGAPAAVVISAIGGTAGVGKTALAVHWAHQVADRFPDGQLHVNLRGFDPAGNPTPPAAAIRALLEALEVPAERIPASLDAQAGLYRSLMAGKRMLLVLDNARDAEQVRPLLPGSPGCLVLVTSRSHLAGLAALEGAHSLPLGLLTDAEAHALLAARLGPARLAAEPGATAELIRLCAHLPLALVIVSAQAVARADFPLAVHAAGLRDGAGRLEALDTGDPAASVRSVFSWSYRQLSPAAARLFRLLGLHPGPDISAGAAASLAGYGRDQVRRLLATLADAHLLAEHVPGRFSCHDLLRSYAAGLAAAHDAPAERRAATGRLLDYYLHTAHAGHRLLRPFRVPITLTAARPGAVAERLAGPEQAMAWYEAEHQSLLAATRYAAESGFTRHAWQLPESFGTYLNVRGHWDDLIATQHTALTAATALGDHTAQALAHDRLGFACALRGRHDQAASHFGQALEKFQQAGDLTRQAGTHLNVSFLLARQGRYAEAADHDKRALHIYQAAGDRSGQALALNAAGWNLAHHGDHQGALASCQQALTLQRQLGERLDEATTLDSLGYIHHLLGQHADAIHCYQQALHLLAGTKERPRTAIALDHLGDTHHAAGQPHQARTAWQQALDILSDLDNPDAALVRAKLRQLSPNGAGPAPAATQAKP
jgi:DNA-binding SARP family transcriptional activator